MTQGARRVPHSCSCAAICLNGTWREFISKKLSKHVGKRGHAQRDGSREAIRAARYISLQVRDGTGVASGGGVARGSRRRAFRGGRITWARKLRSVGPGIVREDKRRARPDRVTRSLLRCVPATDYPITPKESRRRVSARQPSSVDSIVATATRSCHPQRGWRRRVAIFS